MQAQSSTPVLIAVINQKGGVGKSTFAVHLAVWHHEQGKRVALVDADVQGSSARWMQASVPDLHVEALHEPDDILERARVLREEYEVIVADGPPGLAEITRALLLVADVALVPCGPSLLEVEAAHTAVRVIKNAQAIRGGNPRALLVLNRLQADRFTLTREAVEAVEQLGIPRCGSVLRLRQAVADAPGQRSVVWNMGSKAKQAADEMTAIIREVEAYGRA